jgi:hypothetical protein
MNKSSKMKIWRHEYCDHFNMYNCLDMIMPFFFYKLESTESTIVSVSNSKYDLNTLIFVELNCLKDQRECLLLKGYIHPLSDNNG